MHPIFVLGKQTKATDVNIPQILNWMFQPEPLCILKSE